MSTSVPQGLCQPSPACLSGTSGHGRCRCREPRASQEPLRRTWASHQFLREAGEPRSTTAEPAGCGRNVGPRHAGEGTDRAFSQAETPRVAPSAGCWLVRRPVGKGGKMPCLKWCIFAHGPGLLTGRGEKVLGWDRPPPPRRTQEDAGAETCREGKSPQGSWGDGVRPAILGSLKSHYPATRDCISSTKHLGEAAIS